MKRRYSASDRLIIAPTRTGKGRDILIPALLDGSDSCLVIDPKGECDAVTLSDFSKRRRGMVVCLDPYRLLDRRKKQKRVKKVGPI